MAKIKDKAARRNACKKGRGGVNTLCHATKEGQGRFIACRLPPRRGMQLRCDPLTKKFLDQHPDLKRRLVGLLREYKKLVREVQDSEHNGQQQREEGEQQQQPGEEADAAADDGDFVPEGEEGSSGAEDASQPSSTAAGRPAGRVGMRAWLVGLPPQQVAVSRRTSHKGASARVPQSGRLLLPFRATFPTCSGSMPLEA